VTCFFSPCSPVRHAHRCPAARLSGRDGRLLHLWRDQHQLHQRYRQHPELRIPPGQGHRQHCPRHRRLVCVCACVRVCVCVCDAGSTGTIGGLAFSKNCLPEPYGMFCRPSLRTFLTFPLTFAHARTGDLAQQHNPTCDLRTYKGGLSYCHHGWFLLDADQEVPPGMFALLLQHYTLNMPPADFFLAFLQASTRCR
jgi:hypothetical protein